MTGAVVVNAGVIDRLEVEREHERLLASLAFERNRLASMFQEAPAFTALLRGKEHIFELANDAYYQVVGFRELIGKPTAVALPEVVSQGFIDLLDRVLETGEPYVASQMRVMLQRMPHAPLEERFVSFVYQPFDEADGTHSGVLVNGIDVTDQVRSAEGLRQSEQRYRTVVELSPDGIVVHRGGRIMFANGAAARMAGSATPADLEGQSINDFVHPDSRSEVEARVQTMEAGGEPPPAVQHWRRLDGTTIVVEVTSRPIVFDGSPAIQTIFRDVTEKLLLEAQLRDAQKMESVGRLAGGIAHDFNNILTAIRGYAGMVRESLTVTHPSQQDLSEIEQAVDRAAALTRHLLAYGRKQTLRTEIVDISAMLGAMESVLRRLIGEHNELVMRVGEGRHLVMADRGQLEQVVTNLAVNARDAMPDGGTVLIDMENVVLIAESIPRNADILPGCYTRLVIEDTGCGMVPSMLNQAFEPYFTTKTFGNGTGLGLSAVHGIVKQSKGHVRLESTPGVGTRVTVWLPAASEATNDAAAAASVCVSDESVPRTVVIAEDSAAVRSVIRRSLEAVGFSVIESTDGRQALDTIMRSGDIIDLLITDLSMPRMGGRKLIASLRELGHRPALIIMSGRGGGSTPAADDFPPEAVFIDKPFTTSVLIATVNRAFEARRAAEDATISAMGEDAQ